MLHIDFDRFYTDYATVYSMYIYIYIYTCINLSTWFSMGVLSPQAAQEEDEEGGITFHPWPEKKGRYF